jgi:hypothetical protein
MVRHKGVGCRSINRMPAFGGEGDNICSFWAFPLLTSKADIAGIEIPQRSSPLPYQVCVILPKRCSRV